MQSASVAINPCYCRLHGALHASSSTSRSSLMVCPLCSMHSIQWTLGLHKWNGRKIFDEVLEEMRPYLAGTGGGDLELVEIEEPIVKIRLGGPAAGVLAVRVALTQKLREKIPAIAAVYNTLNGLDTEDLPALDMKTHSDVEMLLNLV